MALNLCSKERLKNNIRGVTVVDQKAYVGIAKLEVQLQSMNATVMRIEEKLDYNQKNYIQCIEIEEVFKFHDREI